MADIPIGEKLLEREQDPDRDPIPMAKPSIGEAEIEAVRAVLQDPDGRLSIGDSLKGFEKRVCDKVGARYAVGLSSGTAGLHLCMIAAGVRRGDLVITSPFSFVASANCILYQSAVPVFVDVEEETGNLDPGQVKEAVSALASASRWLPRSSPGGLPDRRMAAILPVHAFGQPADMDPILEVAKEHELPVIEDACEALGSHYRGRPVGGLGSDAAVFAFYPNKQITTGEGGMIVCDREDWASQFVSLRNQGRDSFATNSWLEHNRLGYNYRLDELSAALGCAQMDRLDALVQARQLVADWYSGYLEDIDEVEAPQVVPGTTRMSWFVYVIRLRPGLDQSRIMEGLQAEGIPTRPYFSPIHLQPYYRERFGYQEGDFPVAEELGKRSLALPFFPNMKESQVMRVCQSLRQVLVKL